MEQNAYVLANFNRPSLTDVLPRKRLFDTLDRLRKHPVIWVTGYPGCGKTALIRSYVDNCGLPYLWYQIEEGGADLAALSYRTGPPAETAVLREGSIAPHLTGDSLSEYLSESLESPPRCFENLCRRLEAPGLLVFDNFQEVPSSSPFHEIVRKGLSKIPEGLTVILISRRYPPQCLVRLLANNQMALLGWNDLCLTSDESERIIRLQIEAGERRETAPCLHRTAGGWAAGLILLLQRAKREGMDLQLPFRQVPEEIGGYFAGEVFESMDSETQDFMLKTAFLPRMTAEMAEELTGHQLAYRIFSELIRRNCFTEELFLPELTYQYHPLFREFLLSRAKETLLAEDVVALCRQAAKILEATGQIEAAFAILDDAGDQDEKIRLILKHAPSIASQRRNSLLESWLETLPKEKVENTPWLLYWMGACRLPFNPRLSKSYFEQAFERFWNEGDETGVLLAWSGVIESITYGSEGLAELDKWILILEGIMLDLNTFPSQEIEERVVFGIFVALVLRRQQYSTIEEWAKRAFSLAQESSNINAKMQTLAHLAIYRILTGDFKNAAFAVGIVRRLLHSEMVGSLARIMGLYVEALYCQVAGTYERCLEAVSDGLQLARDSHVHVMDCLFLGQAVASALNSGDHGAAEKFLKEMSSSFDPDKALELCEYYFLATRAALIQGDFKQAALHVELALKGAVDAGFPIPLCMACLLKAYVVYEFGEDREAAQHLARASDIASRTESRLLRYYVSWAEARFAFDQGREASGRQCLEKALAIGRELGYFNSFIEQPSVMAGLCAKALDAGIETRYVHEIIRKHKLTPNRPPLHVENWPWALQIFTLGRFSLVRDRRPVQFSGKAQEKPLSLLKTLIALGGRGVRQDRIANALWPEADGDMMLRSFATTLHRLRKMIGIHEALELRNGCLTLDQRYCWVDVWAFERALGEADRTWGKGTNSDTEKAVALLQKGIEIYHGNFLSGETGEPWEIAFSERLRSKFLRGVGRLGDHWEGGGEWEKAVECYQRALEVDPMAEDLYGRLIVCYQRLGRRANAMSLYNRLQRLLSAALGIGPSAEIEEIYSSITHQEG